MERKSIVINIPDGMCIDESKSTFEKIVFKKKDTKPRSWEEYCSNLKEGFYFGLHGEKKYLKYGDTDCEGMKTLFLDPYYPKAFEALMQLMSLRQAWIGDWEPNWNGREFYNCIVIFDNKYIVEDFSKYHKALSFPTREMAIDFMDCFKDLLEVAKPLI